MLQIAAEKLAIYRAAAQKQQARKREQLLRRQAQGRAIAQQAADLLKTQFGATRVVLFGSLLQVELMHSQSDIDLAVWGLSEQAYLRALAQLLDLSDFSVGLIEAEHAAPKLLSAIQTTGVDL